MGEIKPMKVLIIAEKPKVGLRIASALSKNYSRRRIGRVSYYEIKNGSQDIIVASAAGHLFTLRERKSTRSYPVFDVEWAPLYEVEKGKGYVRQYINVLKKLGKDADLFIIATDYDIEGELLGYNALKFGILQDKAIDREKVKRMRFSTLTSAELKKAFENLAEVDYRLVEAGETRHILDWYWGINVSRALSQAASDALKKFAVFSAGRVQTPALAILVEREREIANFKPEPYIQIYALLRIGRRKLKAEHALGRIFDLTKAERIYTSIKDEKQALVESVIKQQRELPPPTPFDLGTLQSEAYKYFRLTPKQTQDIAQNLYEAGYISYPRTSSQKLPPGIGYRRIIEALGKNPEFKSLAQKLLSKPKLKPRQGKKDDPAHPAIYPTGVVPEKLSPAEQKVYSLIVHRFFAVFAEPAVQLSQKITLSIGGEPFKLGAMRVLSRGWLDFYPYLKLEEVDITLQEGEKLKVEKIIKEEKQTSPPRRYNPASLVRKLESLGLGTKATRAEIVDTLYKREYITGVSIKVTPLGMRVIETLERYIPRLIDEKLTRHFEEKIEKIQQGKATKEETLREAREELKKTLEAFKERSEKIGEDLAQGYAEKERQNKIVGKCPNCGSDLRIIKSKSSKKQFIGCSNYPECTTSFPLPQNRRVEPTDKLCPECGLPMVKIWFGRRRVLSCIDMNCKSKKMVSQNQQ